MPDPQPDKLLFSELALNKTLLKTLVELNREYTTPVQAKTIPLALECKDLLVSAQTGSGKTMAYLLPTLHLFLNNAHKNTNGTRALILVPTRELAIQTHKHCKELTNRTTIKSVVITGGHDYRYQSSVLRKNPELIIATPGRLMELIEKGNAGFETLEVLIVDEADRMLDMDFSTDVLNIISHCNKQRQTLLFSATLKQKGLSAFFNQIVQSPETVVINPLKENHQDIEQQIILADNNSHKEKLLSWLLNHDSYKKALVFSNTRIQANQLGGLLRYQKIKAGVLHGEMKQPQRKQILGLFSQGAIDVLVASDVAARGLDIKEVDLIINIGMPHNSNDYIHRIGRTGRAGERGFAITLVGPDEWNAMISTERYLNIKFKRRSIKELKAKFKGPKKIKSSGKAAGTKKRKSTTKEPNKKLKSTNKPNNKYQASKKPIDGFSPLKKK